MTKLKICASLFLLLCCFCNSAFADPEVGWWWNPNESGRGFFVESQGGVTFIGAYLYDDDGHAKWFVSGGPNLDPYNWTGDMYSEANGQTLFGTYVAPGNAVVVGQLSVHFNDDTHGMLTWPGGTIAIERQRFGGPDLPVPPDPGWWWNDQESGRGYSVEVQGDRIFIVGFMYDDSGRPVWYYSAGQMASETEYTGPWLQFANGQTMTGPYQPPSPPVPVGQLSVEFTAIDQATFEFDDLAAAALRMQPKGGRSTLVDVKREFPKKPTYVPADRYEGTIHYKEVTKQQVTQPITGVQFTLTITLNATGTLTWDDGGLPDLPDPADTFRKPSWTYGLVKTSVTYGITLSGAGGGVSCSGQSSGTAGNLVSTLRVNGYGEYTGSIGLADVIAGPLPMLTFTCTSPDGTGQGQVPFPVIITMNLKGKAISQGFAGKLKPKPGSDVITGDWAFAVTQ
jgi:hypothetical protein